MAIYKEDKEVEPVMPVEEDCGTYIIMVYENQVLLGDTIAEALSGIKGVTVKESSTAPPTDAGQKTNPKRRSDLLKQIEDHTREIQRLLKELNNA
jgi:uncharacterized membrane protein (UPF0182 family)